MIVHFSDISTPSQRAFDTRNVIIYFRYLVHSIRLFVSEIIKTVILNTACIPTVNIFDAIGTRCTPVNRVPHDANQCVDGVIGRDDICYIAPDVWYRPQKSNHDSGNQPGWSVHVIQPARFWFRFRASDYNIL